VIAFRVVELPQEQSRDLGAGFHGVDDA